MRGGKEDETTNHLMVVAFYSFTPIESETIFYLLNELPPIAEGNDVKGTVLVANEGINGTICGPSDAVDSLIERFANFLPENSLNLKVSWSSMQAFRRFKIRAKPEIVTMGVPGINPSKSVGTYIDPHCWNSCLDDPETLVIDTRNDYEISIGSFDGAINPHTESFRQFPSWVQKHLRPLVEETSPKHIAMFCTGGIRCEKATSFLKAEGFKGVQHLHGGILRYIEEIPAWENRWQGECFVFDQRVALNHDLLPGVHSLCYACGMPLSPKDRDSSSYVPGVQCRHCVNLFTDSDRLRFAERQKQYEQRFGVHSMKQRAE